MTLALAGLAALAALCLILILVLALRLRRMRREYRVLRGDKEASDIFAVLHGVLTRMKSMDHRVDEVVAGQQELTTLQQLSLQRFGLVRYDAFGDMGGQLSFSAAMLDDHGDGLVLTSINGRTESRSYAKPVRGLESPYNLSDEEREAVSIATGAYGRGDERPAPTRSR